MISEDLLKKLKFAELSQTTESLQDLCSALIRKGYSNPRVEDEDVSKVFAVIVRPDTGQEFKVKPNYGRNKSKCWVPKGQGYRYQQYDFAISLAIQEQRNLKKPVKVMLCLPTDPISLFEWEVGDKEKLSQLQDKILDLKEFKKLLKIREEYERTVNEGP